MADMIPEPIVIDLKGRKWQGVWEEVIYHLPDTFAGTPRFVNRPLSNVVEQLERLGCSHLVVGYPFRDEDYIYDYLHDIGGTFRDHGKHCIRLHFFSGDRRLEEATIIQDLHDLPRPPVEKTDSTRYLGFMVIRPTGEDCVGRTIIHHPVSESTGSEPTDSESTRDKSAGPFIHVMARYECNFFGSRLAVNGAPFMQQDRSSHVCAGAALWGMCLDLHRRFHTPRLFPRQITEIATAYDPKAEFAWGLSAQHMSHVLRHIGCGNDLLTVRLERLPEDEKDLIFREAIDVLYGYVQSNMPVLLGYWPQEPASARRLGHAVLVVGHDFHEYPVNPNKNAQGVWSSEYVGKWFCADDQRGPYQPLHVWAGNKEWDGPMEEEEGEEQKQEKKKVVVLQRARQLIILPGLTRNARMTYRDAKERIDELLKGFAAQAPLACGEGDSTENDIVRELEKISFGCRRRLYLQLSTQFRSQLLDSGQGRTGLGGEILDAYCRLPLPTHLYVCDFCSRKPNKGRYGLVGEVLLDATAPKFAHKHSVLSVRIEDRMLFWRGDKPLSLTDKGYWDDSRNHKLAPSNREYGRPR